MVVVVVGLGLYIYGLRLHEIASVYRVRARAEVQVED